MAPIKFNNKDLLSKVRLEVINPLVDSYKETSDNLALLKVNVTGVSKRLAAIEPTVTANSANLTALNQFAQAVAQQVSMSYDKSRVDVGNKRVVFTSVGGTENTLDLSPMFIDPVQTTIDISKDDGTPAPAHQLNFKGNAVVSSDVTDRSKVHVLIPHMQGKINNTESDINKIELIGNIANSSLENNTLKVYIPSSSGGGKSGFYMEPNPPVLNNNLFEAKTKVEAEASRDSFFTANPAVLATYDENVFKLILVEWEDNASMQLQFQCRHNNTWSNAFDFTFTSFLIGQHSVEELKDGSRIPTLEAETVTDGLSVGAGTNLFKGKEGRNLKFSKLRSDSQNLTIRTDTTSDSEVIFHSNPNWKGYFETLDEATAGVSILDRIANKTTVLSKASQNTDSSIFVWDGTNWIDKWVKGSAKITDDGYTWEALRGLKHGYNITFTKTQVSESEYFHTIDALSPVYARIPGSRSQRVSTIEVANQYAELENEVLKIPVISAVDRASGDLGQIKNIKQGDNINFDLTAGILSISADQTTGLTGRVGKNLGWARITKIEDPSEYSTITDGLLKLHRIHALGSDNADFGEVKSLKVGNNIGFALDDGRLIISADYPTVENSLQVNVPGSTDYRKITKIKTLNPSSSVSDEELVLPGVGSVRADGVSFGPVSSLKEGSNVFFDYESSGQLVINSAASGGTLQGKTTGGNFPNVFLPITKIDITSDRNLSKLVKNEGDATYSMVLDTRSFVVSAATKEELDTKHPFAANAYRHGFVDDKKEVYFSDGTEWFLQNFRGLPENVKSLASRYPGIQPGDGTYDPEKFESGLYYTTKANCPLPSAENKEYGIVENITISKTKRSQFYWGLETGSIWYRIMNPEATLGVESDFLEWRMTSGLSDDFYSVLTIPSIALETSNQEIKGLKPLTWMVLQDPRCNVSVDSSSPEYFHVNASGVYDFTACVHITATSDTDAVAVSTGADYTFTLTDVNTGQVVGQPVVIRNVKVPGSTEIKYGMYPAVRATFPNVKAKAQNQYKITIKMSRATHLKRVYLDSFKNYLVVQPSSSGTKQGIVIAESFRRGFGGFSSKPGYEVHIEGVKTSPKNVRVFGTVINDSVVTR